MASADQRIKRGSVRLDYYFEKYRTAMDKEEKLIPLRKEEAWLEAYKKKHPNASDREVENELRKEKAFETLQNKGFLRIAHERGYIVVDLEGFLKLSKAAQKKILSLAK